VRIFGFEKEEVLGKNINSLNLICEEDIPIVARTMERLLTGKELKVVSENRNYRKNKEIIKCVWYNSVLTDESGKMSSIMSLVEDVSEIRRKENLLREGEAKLRSVLNATQESIYMFDREGRFTISNSTGVKRLGKHSEDEILGHHFKDFVPAKIVADRMAKLEEVFKTGKSLEFEDLRENMVFHHYFSPVLRDNQVISVVTYSTDITERKRAENEIRESEAKLKELNATKDKFFNIVAHDLKNPFTSLMGSSELLYENIHTMSPDNIKKLASILNDSAKGGYSILQNLLDWSRSQTGLLKITPQKINLKNLVEENISNLQLPAANKQISLNTESKEDIYVISDKNMINTILRNLLSNAIKFTRKGGNVTVNVITEADKFIIQVKDNGIGISPDKIEKLFDLETKHTEPGTEKEQGTGLGLKLSKEFVEKLGGTIKVVSNENEGSKFSFSIPLKN
jgi:PAS domain S-box-containing protein